MSKFMEVQKQLNAKKLSSHLELIWPLPGETLETFKKGVNQLCSIGAESFLIYPFLLLNNIQIAKDRDKFKLVTVKDKGGASEVEIVIGTNKVTLEEYKEGIRFVFAVTILYSLRCLTSLGYYLNLTGKATYDQLFSAFVDYCHDNEDFPLVMLCEQMIENLEHVDFHSTGIIIHHVLHEHREAFERFLVDFVKNTAWWQDEKAQAFFEIDLINRPLVYLNTPVRKKECSLQHVTVIEITNEGYIVEVPAEYEKYLDEIVELKGNRFSEDHTYSINHRMNQFAYVQSNTSEQNAFYCEEKLHAMRSILPTWQAVKRTDYSEPVSLNASSDILEEDEGDFVF